MSIKSNEEYEQQRNKQVSKMRSILDYSMGLIIIAIGVFLFFRSELTLSLNKKFVPDNWDKVYGVVAFMYGIWRIYRGYKKNYFK